MNPVLRKHEAMEWEQHREAAKMARLVPTPPRSRLIRKTVLWRVRSGWKKDRMEHAEKSFRMRVAARKVIACITLRTVGWAVNQLWSHQFESLCLESEAISTHSYNGDHHS